MRNDATKKLLDEGFKRPWQPLIKMDAAVKEKMEKLFQPNPILKRRLAWPLASFPFPSAHPRQALPSNLGLEATIASGLPGARVCDPQHVRRHDALKFIDLGHNAVALLPGSIPHCSFGGICNHAAFPE